MQNMSTSHLQQSHVTVRDQMSSIHTDKSDIELGAILPLHIPTHSLQTAPLPITSSSSHLVSCARAARSRPVTTTSGDNTTTDLFLEAQSRKDRGYVVVGTFSKHGVISNEKIVWVKGAGDLFRALRAEERNMRSHWRRWFGLKEVRSMGVFKVCLFTTQSCGEANKPELIG